MKQEWNKKRVVPPGIEIPGIPTRKLVTGTVEQWKCRFDDPNVAFHSEQLHLWTEDRVYGFMQSDGCAVVVDMPRCPESLERE